jgi:hypothetical protein
MGILLFSTNAIEQKRNEIINECALLASEAQLYYRRPKDLGGGGKSFVGWDVPPQYITTEVGRFEASVVSPSEVKITGTGNEVVTSGDSVKVELVVNSLAYRTKIIN